MTSIWSAHLGSNAFLRAHTHTQVLSREKPSLQCLLVIGGLIPYCALIFGSTNSHVHGALIPPDHTFTDAANCCLVFCWHSWSLSFYPLVCCDSLINSSMSKWCIIFECLWTTHSELDISRSKVCMFWLSSFFRNNRTTRQSRFPFLWKSEFYPSLRLAGSWQPESLIPCAKLTCMYTPCHHRQST